MKYAIAVDFGGTKIKGCIVDDEARIIKSMKTLTEADNGKKQVLQNISRVVSQLESGFTKPISGIGISMPGFADKTGKVLFAGNLLSGLVGVNLKKELKKVSALPVFIENDANCFALAEAIHGAGKNHGIVIGIIWGSGLGSGIVIDRKIYSGSIGGAGETGHILIRPDIKSSKFGAGHPGSLEMLVSGKNIERMYREKGGKMENPTAEAIYASKEKITKQIFDSAIDNLGIGLSTIVNIVNPDIIVMGGGVSNLSDDVYKKLRTAVRKYALPTHTKKLKISRYKISDDAGVLGAAGLVFQQTRQ
ncbi:MAG: ROK family protein [Candidatus Woesearchaeota archaeon]